MRAIVVENTGSAEVLQLQETPKAEIKAGELLVNNKFVGVNYIDTYFRRGIYPATLPLIPGREASGVVVEVGAGVAGFSVGDRVAYIGTGAYAEYTAVEERNIIKLPASISFEVGASLLLQGMTATYLLFDAYKVKAGDFVLVPAAAGGTGGLICQLASSLGAAVIGLVSTPAKAEIARQNGAHHTINYVTEDFVSEVMKITGQQGVQVVYDGVGKEVYKSALSCLAKRGAYVNFGNASGKIESVNPFDLVKSITFSRPGLFTYIETKEEFNALAGHVLQLVVDGKLKIEIHKIYDLSAASEAHIDLEGRKTTGKLLLKI